MAKQPKGELVVIGFNYDLLETKLADEARDAEADEWCEALAGDGHDAPR